MKKEIENMKIKQSDKVAIEKAWLWVETFLLGRGAVKEEIETIQTNFFLSLGPDFEDEKEENQGYPVKVVTDEPDVCKKGLVGLSVVKDLEYLEEQLDSGKTLSELIAINEKPKDVIEDLFSQINNNEKIKGMGDCDIDDLPF